MFTVLLDHYYIDVGSFPTTLQRLEALHKLPGDLIDPLKWEGPYATKAIPLDPWGREYVYQSADGQNYSISSFGPDGQQGTADDIVENSSNSS